MEGLPIHNTFPHWIFPIFAFIFMLIALLRILFPNRFAEYVRLPINNRYIIIYEKKGKKIQLFTFISALIQWLSLSLFIYLWLDYINFEFPYSTQFLFIDIFLALFILLGLKFIIQYGLRQLFELKSFGKNYVFSRLAYSSYAGIVMVLLLFAYTYAFSFNEWFFYIVGFIFLIINILSWINIVKLNQNQLKRHLIYFILYLCTLEIAPYILLYCGMYWV